MSEPLLDLDRLVAGVRWRRRVWVLFALLGLIGGIMLTLLLPPSPTAVTRVLVSRTDDQLADRTRLMETDIALLQTMPVAKAALAKTGEAESPSAFLSSYSGEGVTVNVLEITVTASTADRAAVRARALAEAFVEAQVRRAQDLATAQADALLARQAELQQTVVEINDQIIRTTTRGAAVPAGSVAASQLAADLDALYARRAGLYSQVLDLGERADQGRIAAGVVAVGTTIVDPARASAPSLLRAGLTNSVVGLVLGLGAGILLSAILAVARHRPLLRREIAAELSASVVIEVPGRRLWGLRGLRWGARAHHQRRAATTLTHLVRHATNPVAILEIGCPDAAAALGIEMARQVARQRPVVLIDDLRRGHVRFRPGSDDSIQVRSRADVPEDGSPTGDALTLIVGSIGPGAAWTDLVGIASEALLVVRAGRVSTAALHTAAQQLAFAGIHPMGVVLVNAYPGDHSDGARWHAVHTALHDAAPHEGHGFNGHRLVSTGALAQPYVAPRQEVDTDN